jgi:acyl-CoA thioesterase
MSEAQQLAERVVAGMMAKDEFSRWLGIEVVDVGPDRSTVRMTVRKEMVNGFGVAHGGIVYSLDVSALAFASNTHGKVTVAIDNSITYPAPIHVGDVITATASMISSTRRLSFLKVDAINQKGETVASFKGTVYKTEKEHASSRA